MHYLRILLLLLAIGPGLVAPAFSFGGSYFGGVSRAQLGNSSGAAGLGADMLGQGVKAVETLVDLRSINVSSIKPRTVYLFERGGGLFLWKDGDYSSSVDSDPFSGIYVAPSSDLTGGSGVWVRAVADHYDIDWFGLAADGVTDDSSAANSALSVAAGGVLFWSKGQAAYRVEILNIPADITIIFEPGTVLKTPLSNPDGLTRFFQIVSVDDVTIRGNGVDLVMENGSYTSEFSHAINVSESKRVLLENIDIFSTGGDGVYIGGATASENIALSGIRVDGAKRNGLSVVSAEHVLVEGSSFDNTGGAHPESGIDIEPNPGSYTRHIYIDSTSADNNVGSGFVVAMEAENVFMSGLQARNNGGIGVQVDGKIDRIARNVFIDKVVSTGNSLNLFLEYADTVKITDFLSASSGGMGVQILESSSVNLRGFSIVGSAGRGLYIGTSDGVSVSSTDIFNNLDAGVFLSAVKNVVFDGNSINSNATSVSPSYDSNVYVFSAEDSTFTDNLVRVGSNANTPDYGIYFRNTTSNTNNLIVGNDCLNGGSLGGIVANSADATNGGNRNGDGSYSVTAN